MDHVAIALAVSVGKAEHRCKPDTANHEADQGGESSLDFKSATFNASQTQPTKSAGGASSPYLDFAEGCKRRTSRATA